MSSSFKLQSKFSPTGDQPKAIKSLTQGFFSGEKYQTLLGVTGSGKTYTLANVIQNTKRPTLVIAHNKTLAAQLADEFREFFPNNSVQYFVSYYDYYQPEAYIPSSDTYIEKDSSINDEIDRLRHAATQALLTRKDVIIVASVSCIYGIGSPEVYKNQILNLRVGDNYSRKFILEKLDTLQYQRNDYDLKRGIYRVKGETIEIFPAYNDFSYKIVFYADQVEKIESIDSVSGVATGKISTLDIYPAKHFLPPNLNLKPIISNIRKDLKAQINYFKKNNKLIEAQRIEERVNYDLEMIEETGYCNGIENYSLYFDNRKKNSPPNTLIDFFPKDFLLLVDESHMTIPQIRGMYAGDRSRKQTLVNFGFRLPAALDNRPLKFEEFERKLNQVIFSSATPGDYELRVSKTNITEQLIRPTGVIDPEIEIRQTKNQIDDLLSEIRLNNKNNGKTLITTLTKRMAEELSSYLEDSSIKVAYIHSDIKTLERSQIINDLRVGKYDVIVGINLLREGIDLPEVSLVAILDADKEGFLRGKIALIQTIGRAARHINGKVIMYADKCTDAMREAITETNRRRKKQIEYNKKNNIIPKSAFRKAPLEKMDDDIQEIIIPKSDRGKIILDLEKLMKNAALNLEFEKAAKIRDQITSLEGGDKSN